jgi:hypothetical protein
MNALLELRKQMEIDFLKTKTYEEINDMFNQMNDKLKLAESEVKKFRLGGVVGRSEQLRTCKYCGSDDIVVHQLTGFQSACNSCRA